MTYRVDRYTPTPVGKTDAPANPRPALVRYTPTPVGKTNRLPTSPLATGTPPRLWGKRRSLRVDVGLLRYTPTPVGKTRIHFAILRSDAVHPHACGENGANEGDKRVGGGTPPRLWGKRSAVASLDMDIRYTPTPVGKTSSPCGGGAVSAVHPHACGENDSAAPLTASSAVHPHACGENVLSAGVRRRCPVHPHACGENSTRRLKLSKNSGTPPRLWGKRSTSASGSATGSVHPHACGENSRQSQFPM